MLQGNVHKAFIIMENKHKPCTIEDLEKKQGELPGVSAGIARLLNKERINVISDRRGTLEQQLMCKCDKCKEMLHLYNKLIKSDKQYRWVANKDLKKGMPLQFHDIQPYKEDDYKDYINSIQQKGLTRDINIDNVPWPRLLNKAYQNAFDKSDFEGDWTFYIETPIGYGCCELGVRDFSIQQSIEKKENYSIIAIDDWYLFGLLTGVYHWNNAEVGSQYRTKRVPDKYNKKVQDFLNFLCVV